MTDFDKDTWRTPPYFVNWVKCSYGVWIDGSAKKENAVFKHWIGEGGMFSDFLDENLGEHLLSTVTFICHSQLVDLRPVIFVNPPYSDVTPFLKQAKRLRDQGIKVVMLLNNDKSTQWYQNHIHNVANEVIDIIGGRIAFIHPITGQEIKGNSKGQMVVVFDPTMEDFVQRSVSLDFIKQVGGYDG